MTHMLHLCRTPPLTNGSLKGLKVQIFPSTSLPSWFSFLLFVCKWLGGRPASLTLEDVYSHYWCFSGALVLLLNDQGHYCCIKHPPSQHLIKLVIRSKSYLHIFPGSGPSLRPPEPDPEPLSPGSCRSLWRRRERRKDKEVKIWQSEPLSWNLKKEMAAAWQFGFWIVGWQLFWFIIDESRYFSHFRKFKSHFICRQSSQTT